MFYIITKTYVALITVIRVFWGVKVALGYGTLFTSSWIFLVSQLNEPIHKSHLFANRTSRLARAAFSRRLSVESFTISRF